MNCAASKVSLCLLVLLQPLNIAVAADQGADGMEELANLFSMFGDMNQFQDDDTAVDVTGGGRKKKNKRKKKKKKQLCATGTYLAPVGLDSLLNAVPRQHFVANGCGPQGMEVQEKFGLWRCCNGHDVCYSTPGATFKYCEDTFGSCMKQVCEENHSGTAQEECHQQAQGFTGMTALFGRGSHASSQRDVSTCVGSPEEAQTRWLSFLAEIHTAGQVAVPSEAALTSMLTAHKGKEGELIDRLVKTYGVPFVKKTGSVEIDFALTKMEQIAMQKMAQIEGGDL